MFPVYASPPQLPTHDATLGSGWSLAFGRAGFTCWVPQRGFSLHDILLLQASPGAPSAESRDGRIEFFDRQHRKITTAPKLTPCSFAPPHPIHAATMPLWQGDTMDYGFALETLR